MSSHQHHSVHHHLHSILVSQVEDPTLFIFKYPFAGNLFHLPSILPYSTFSHLISFNMHASTIAAILAFTAGMTANGAPALGLDVLSNTLPTGLRTNLSNDQAQADNKL